MFPEDAVLALALAIVNHFEQGQSSHHSEPSDSDAPFDEFAASQKFWETRGVVTSLSIDEVVATIKSKGSGESSTDVDIAHNDTNSLAGRLTLTQARRVLSDEQVLRVATASRIKVIQRIWQNGMLARSLHDVNERD